ncbi:tudor domain-containing protein 5-like isoform X2 [Ptychodera flava]|uniref:tudor domain-containing protein 5-like isoform X2 n=1 Tax=Ptychodera flava TaxID=63121 RepID=UPI00396A76EC
MSELAELREEVKKNLRALLISSPTGLTPNQIDNDYRNMLGHPIPYRKLGYNSTLEFLKAIPECAKFTYDRGHLILEGVADVTTKHIASLVSRQKISKSRRGRGRGRGGRGYPSFVRRIPPPPPRGPIKPLMAVDLPTVPAHLRAKVKELLFLYPNGLLGSSFNTAFARRFGHHINFTAMGFKSLGDILKALPDLVTIQPLGGGGFKLFGKVPPPPSEEDEAQNHSQRGLQKIKSSTEFKNISNVTQPSQPKQEEQVVFIGNEVQSQSKEEKVLASRNPETCESVQVSGDVEDEEKIEDVTISYISESSSVENIDAELKEEITAVLSKRPAGMWAARLPHEYKKLRGKDLPLKQLGFYSVIELVALMPDVVTIKRPTPKGDWLLYDAKQHVDQSQEETSSPKKPKDGKPIDDTLKNNIWCSVSSQPSGIFLSNFQSVYWSQVKEKLFPQDYGFTDLTSLFRSIPDVVQVKERLSGCIVLTANPNYQPSPSLTPSEVTAAQPKKWSRFRGVPPDAVGGGVSYSTQVLPTGVEMLEVYLASVVSPENFHIQIKSDQTSLPLDIVMDALEKIYCYPEGDQYMMPDSMLTVGQVCVAIYQQDNNWHRAAITGIRDSEFIEIMYVDYGNTATVPKSCLRLLKSVFLQLPAQAVPARLANIKPAKGVWTKSTRDRILELCKDKPLIAWVIGVEHGVMSCCLCDTSSEVDIHLNDLLIGEGHAIFSPEKPIKNAVSQQTYVNTYMEIEPPRPEVKPSGPEVKPPRPEVKLSGPEVKPARPEVNPPRPDVVQTEEVASIQATSQEPKKEPTVCKQPEITNKQTSPEPVVEDKATATDPIDPMIAIDDGTIGYSLSQEDIELMEQINRELDGVLDMSIEEEEEDDKEETEGEVTPRSVKLVRLGDEEIAHIVKYEGEPYLLSGEISSYLWEIDMLRAMLRKANVSHVKRIILARKDHEELFEEIKSVPGCLQGDEVKPYLTFYHLSSVPTILKIFDCKKEELANHLEQEFETFDPDDGYWKGEQITVYEEEVHEVNSQEAEETQMLVYDLAVDDLKLMLQAMQFRRMRILQAMISDPETCMVDELQYVEQQMTKIRNAIKQKESGHNEEVTDMKNTVTVEDYKTESQGSKCKGRERSSEHVGSSVEEYQTKTKVSICKGHEGSLELVGSSVEDYGSESQVSKCEGHQRSSEHLMSIVEDHRRESQVSKGEGLERSSEHVRSTVEDYPSKDQGSKYDGHDRSSERIGNAVTMSTAEISDDAIIECKIASPLLEARVEPMMKAATENEAAEKTMQSFPEFQPDRSHVEHPIRHRDSQYANQNIYQQQQYQAPPQVSGTALMYSLLGQVMTQVQGGSTQHPATQMYMVQPQMMQHPYTGQQIYGHHHHHHQQQYQYQQQQAVDYYQMQPYLYSRYGFVTGRGRGTAQMLQASNVIPGQSFQNFGHC